MKISNYLVFLTVLLTSCSSGGGGGGDEDNTQRGPQANCSSPGTGVRTVTDASGDASFSFIDIQDVTVNVTDSEIVVTIGLLDIPALLTYNAVNVSDNNQEYGWSVNFDMNCDDASSGDVELSVAYYKQAGVAENSAPLLSFTQQDIWETDDTGNSGSVVGNITANVVGNDLVLSADKTANAILQGITSHTPFNVIASHNAANTFYHDTYPEASASSFPYVQ